MQSCASHYYMFCSVSPTFCGQHISSLVSPQGHLHVLLCHFPPSMFQLKSRTTILLQTLDHNGTGTSSSIADTSTSDLGLLLLQHGCQSGDNTGA